MGPVRGDLRKTQMTHPVKGATGKVSADPESTGVRGAGLDLRVKTGPRDRWDLLALGDSQEGMDCPPLWDLLPPPD